MTRTLILVGSPRGRLSTSSSIAQYLSDSLKEKSQEVEILWIIEQLVLKERIDEMLQIIQKSDTLVLVAPLYDDCQPYNVTKTMEIMSIQENLSGKRFIPIINSGFPEADQISHAAIPIYKLFAKKIGLEWVGSLSIGGGEGLQGTSGKKLDEVGGAAKKTINELHDISTALSKKQVYKDAKVLTFPKFLLNLTLGRVMVWMNNRGWKMMAKKKGVDVDAKPYARAAIG